MVRYHVLSDTRAGEGGYLWLRRLRLRLEREDGTLTPEGTYDFVERPTGLDAVVLVLWHRAPGRAEVLLREAPRVPLDFGRGAPRPPTGFAEVVAGIIERGEEGEPGLRARAAAEAREEAGLVVPPERVRRLGPPVYPSPGLTPEAFHVFSCEVTDAERACAARPEGDGSPFEEGARLTWRPLDEALAACAVGQICDLKTELALRRLADRYRDER